MVGAFHQGSCPFEPSEFVTSPKAATPCGVRLAGPWGTVEGAEQGVPSNTAEICAWERWRWRWPLPRHWFAWGLAKGIVQGLLWEARVDLVAACMAGVSSGEGLSFNLIFFLFLI